MCIVCIILMKVASELSVVCCAQSVTVFTHCGEQGLQNVWTHK